MCAVSPVYGMDTQIFPPKVSTTRVQEVSASINIPLKTGTSVLASCLTMNRYLGGSQQSACTPVGSFENSPESCLIPLTKMMNQISQQQPSLVDSYVSSGASTR